MLCIQYDIKETSTPYKECQRFSLLCFIK